MTKDKDNLEHDAAFMDKYSRQIGAFGMETMARLVRLKCLLVGLKGVGVEAAKNLILAGPGAVTLYDDGLVEPRDIGVNFFLTESDVGKPRAKCVGDKLAELNKMVTVKVHSGKLTDDVIQLHNVMVVTNSKRDDMIRWNNLCRSQTPCIGFIACDVRGAMGYTFTDFGENFVTHDATGETPITRIITDITNEEEGLVTLLGPDEDGKMHELPDSDHDGWIEISDVKGMVSLDHADQSINDSAPMRIKFAKKTVSRIKNGQAEQVEVFDSYRLRIGDTTRFSKYDGGGIMTQHKKPFATSFRSLDTTLRHPVAPSDFGLMFTDGAKFGRAEQIHMALHGLMEFEQQHGRLPRPHDEKEANEVLEYARAGPPNREGEDDPPFKVEVLDDEVIRQIALYADVELHPLAAFFGGVVAQEIVKFTGKFTPLKQWFHFDALEVLPDKHSKPMDTEPLGCRYDHIIVAFGREFHNRLGNVKTFLVGCGALGCEYLKNFAMVGLACGEDGLVTVTDNDRIEVSNLNRQFLFREHNVGQPKSIAAADAVKAMNSSLKVKALEEFVAPTSEHIFHDSFWASLDIVTNALDNVKARLYVDSKCVYYKKPLLESGTLGTKCNVQVVVPHLTQSYSDGPKDSEDGSIPMCTLRNFPSLIEHCIEWSRAQFEDIFVVPVGDAKKFIQDPMVYLNNVKASTIHHPNPQVGMSNVLQELERLRTLKLTLLEGSSMTFEKCISKAFDLFHELFRDKILQLVHNFPEDHVTSSGEKFWSGSKRFPQAVDFTDSNNDMHLPFILTAANLFAVSFGLHPAPEIQLVPKDSPCRDPTFIASVIQKLDVPAWVPNTAMEIAENDEALKKLEEKKRREAMEKGSKEKEELMELFADLEKLDCNGLTFEPADFEKDRDLNFHIDFIYATSNLRAWNYRIPQVSRHKCKMIAGKIIPAIATTTASVTGLAMLEMLKVLQSKPLAAYKDSSNSLGLNMYLMQEPAEADKAKDEYDVIEMSEVKCRPPGFTKWDKTILDIGNVSLGDFFNAFKQSTSLNCDLLFHKVAELGDADPKYKPVSGLMLYDVNAFNPELKALYESKKSTPLLEWICERYGGLVDCNGSFIELQTSCTDDSGNPFKVPTVIFKYK